MYATDDTAAPLIVVTFGGELTEPEFDAYMSDCQARIEHARPYGVVIDTRSLRQIPPRALRRQSEWQRDNWEQIARLNRGTAFVVASSFIRGALRAVFHWNKLPAPYVVVPDFDEGRRWVLTRLEEDGLSRSAET